MTRWISKDCVKKLCVRAQPGVSFACLSREGFKKWLYNIYIYLYICVICILYILYVAWCPTPYLLHLVASKNTHTRSFRTARITEASSLQACKLASNTLLFVNIFFFAFLFLLRYLIDRAENVRGHGRRLRNGALPPRGGYKTLEDGALRSGVTFLNA